MGETLDLGSHTDTLKATELGPVYKRLHKFSLGSGYGESKGVPSFATDLLCGQGQRPAASEALGYQALQLGALIS